jgi:hypothetical protein
MAARNARFWGWIIRAYPAEFRYEYGPEVIEALQERCLEERGASRIRFCIEAAGDLIATACKERYYIMIRDLKHSLRRLIRHPGIAAVAVLSLALGIGANTTMFSVIYTSLGTQCAGRGTPLRFAYASCRPGRCPSFRPRRTARAGLLTRHDGSSRT